MDREKMLESLRVKLDAGYKAYMDDWVSRSSMLVFECAESIHYNQQAYDLLYDGACLNDRQLERLLHYQDPLEVMRDQWAFWNETVLRDEIDISDEMSNALQGFMDNDNDIYEHDEQFTEGELEQGQQM